MPENQNRSSDDDLPSPKATFLPVDCTKSTAAIQLPDELWLTMLESQCTFPPEVFSGVMLNLIKNPNITSSHLFRADIFYDSENDSSGDFVRHLKQDYRPSGYELPGFDLTRTIVRQLVPRNAQLDRPLVQTCHFFNKLDNEDETNVVLYIPHAQRAEDMPFYHPAVSRLAFTHKWRPANTKDLIMGTSNGSISISYDFLDGTTLTTKLERTALRLLQTIHKHGQGQLAGYEKRVHLDQVIPQKRYQDTYARLKAKYGKQLSEQWVEVTDPGKHVFEDIGIAAFLVELWRDMYDFRPRVRRPGEDLGDSDALDEEQQKPQFPGFVDIGCGNGVLVHILLSEGYPGCGFDARARKTWSIFPEHVQKQLRRQVLVPIVFKKSSEKVDEAWHDGTFPSGTFIISNHADELTAWTPLLAYMNASPFIAIPCCSHDLSGARFRAPPTTKMAKEGPTRLPQQPISEKSTRKEDLGSDLGPKQAQAAETGSLKRTEAQKKMPSAYATLCSYVTNLAEEVGYEPEREVLRIPSTRNQCIIGRRRRSKLDSSEMSAERKAEVGDIVKRELGRSVQATGAEWIERAEKLARKPGSGH